jgi:hypothetical protein
MDSTKTHVTMRLIYAQNIDIDLGSKINTISEALCDRLIRIKISTMT